jgi:phosphatidylserine decarboxylase
MFTFPRKLSYAFTDLKVVSGEINRQICAFVESTAIITNFIKWYSCVSRELFYECCTQLRSLIVDFGRFLGWQRQVFLKKSG